MQITITFTHHMYSYKQRSEGALRPYFGPNISKCHQTYCTIFKVLDSNNIASKLGHYIA